MYRFVVITGDGSQLLSTIENAVIANTKQYSIELL